MISIQEGGGALSFDSQRPLYYTDNQTHGDRKKKKKSTALSIIGSCAVAAVVENVSTRNVFAIDSIQHLRWACTWKVDGVELAMCVDDDGFFGGLLLLQGTLLVHTHTHGERERGPTLI